MSDAISAYALFDIEQTGRARDFQAAQMLYREAMKRMHPDSDEARAALNALEGEEKMLFQRRLEAAMTLLKDGSQHVEETLRAKGINVRGRKAVSPSGPVNFTDKTAQEIDDAVLAILLDDSGDAPAYPTAENVQQVIKRAFAAVDQDMKLDKRPDQPAKAHPAPREWAQTAPARSARGISGLQSISRDEAQKLVNYFPDSFKALHELQGRKPDLCLYDAVMALVKPEIYRQHKRRRSVESLLNVLAEPFGAIDQARAEVTSIAPRIALNTSAQMLYDRLGFLKEYITDHLLAKCARRQEHGFQDDLLNAQALSTKLDDDPYVMQALEAPKKPVADSSRGMSI